MATGSFPEPLHVALVRAGLDLHYDGGRAVYGRTLDLGGVLGVEMVEREDAHYLVAVELEGIPTREGRAGAVDVYPGGVVLEAVSEKVACAAALVGALRRVEAVAQALATGREPAPQGVPEVERAARLTALAAHRGSRVAEGHFVATVVNDAPPFVEGEPRPPFAYTIGVTLHTGLPELAMMGVPAEVAGALFQDVFGAMQAGSSVGDGDVRDDLGTLAGGGALRIRFEAVPADVVEDVFAQLGPFYEARGRTPPAVLQLVFPDPDGRLPGEAGYALDPRLQDLARWRA